MADVRYFFFGGGVQHFIFILQINFTAFELYVSNCTTCNLIVCVLYEYIHEVNKDYYYYY